MTTGSGIFSANRCQEIDHIQDTALVGGEESAAPRWDCLES